MKTLWDMITLLHYTSKRAGTEEQLELTITFKTESDYYRFERQALQDFPMDKFWFDEKMTHDLNRPFIWNGIKVCLLRPPRERP